MLAKTCIKQQTRTEMKPDAGFKMGENKTKKPLFRPSEHPSAFTPPAATWHDAGWISHFDSSHKHANQLCGAVSGDRRLFAWQLATKRFSGLDTQHSENDRRWDVSEHTDGKEMEAERRGGGDTGRGRRGKQRRSAALSPHKQRCELCQHAGSKAQDKTLVRRLRKMEMQFQNTPRGMC